MSPLHRVNKDIRAKEVRLLTETGENIGVVSIEIALEKALEAGLDLVEISPNALPPIAKIIDYGKFLYSESKKQKAAKSKAHTVEVKGVQIKIGTGDHDLGLKAKKTSEWIKEGHRVKIDLFLPGRTKYMDEKFLKERMGRFFNLLSEDYKIAEPPKKSPKGLSAVIEKGNKAAVV